MNDHLEFFLLRAKNYLALTQEMESKKGERRVEFLRMRLRLFDLLEWWIFKETLLKGLPLNQDEENWLSIAPKDRCAILWKEEGMF